MLKYTLEDLKKLHDEYLLTEDDEHKDEHYGTDRYFAEFNSFLDFLSEREKTPAEA